jgi:hypothetical protein
VSLKETTLIEELKALEQKQNEGRGVSCVRSIIFYIEKEDLSSANAVCFNEGDKLRSYPEIVKVLRKMFPEYDQFLRRWED